MLNGPIAQWLELRPHKPMVGGSNPSGPTNKRCEFLLKEGEQV